ncbi:crescent membrane and immature virion formation protein [Equine molluscum contagiosum-like virus]|nr:crescent membrane and immature virion formation protein [Equine molluscum contagiosum-like virus]
MDRGVKLLADTLFADALSTKDIYVLLRALRAQTPARTLFSRDARGGVCVDFEYAQGVLASDYLREPRTPLVLGQYREHAALVAQELTAVGMIDEDPRAHLRASPHLRRFMRVYRDRARMARLERAHARAAARGVDYAFVQHAL